MLGGLISQQKASSSLRGCALLSRTSRHSKAACTLCRGAPAPHQRPMCTAFMLQAAPCSCKMCGKPLQLLSAAQITLPQGICKYQQPAAGGRCAAVQCVAGYWLPFAYSNGRQGMPAGGIALLQDTWEATPAPGCRRHCAAPGHAPAAGPCCRATSSSSWKTDSPEQLFACCRPQCTVSQDMPKPLISAAGATAWLRDVWEATGFYLERLQAAEECVEAEKAGLAHRTTPQWNLPFTPAWTPDDKLQVCVPVMPACNHVASDS